MSTALELIAAIGGVLATSGAWRTEATARWQARGERLRADAARRENELHRMRYAEVYNWWHDMPDGPARIRAMHWFGEWTGARHPYHGADQGAIPPGFGCRDADDAYDRYIGFLDAVYHPDRLGPPPLIAVPDEAPAIAEQDKTDAEEPAPPAPTLEGW